MSRRFRPPKIKISKRSNGKTITKSYPLRKEHRAGVLSPGELGQLQNPIEVPSTSRSASVEPARASPDNGASLQSANKTNRYTKYRDRNSQDWEDNRDSLLQGACSAFQEPPKDCSWCGLPGPVYSCSDCGPTAFFCEPCVVEQHSRRPFHLIHKWQDLTWVQCSYPMVPVLEHPEHTCPSSYRELITVFNGEGHPVQVLCKFCNCEPSAKTLARWNLWPLQVKKPTVCFAFALLEWMRFLMVECHVSKSGFVEMLSWKNQLTPEQKSCLRRTLHSESWEEYRHMKFRLGSMQHVDPRINDGTTCPACPIKTKEPSTSTGDEEPRVLLSMDANFGLVRKKSAGTSSLTSCHGNRLFMDQLAVREYLTKCDDNKPRILAEECNNFQAGDKVRSKVKNTKLDITGVFGAVCRHEVPQLFLDLECGERLAYPCLLLREWFSRHPQTATANIFYDIACIFDKFLKKCEDGGELLAKIQLAIPAFHCYGHQSSCQVLYSPRRQTGFATTDGEAMERLWSYLRPFGKITKEMTIGHRRDLLTDALLHYGMKKKINLALSLWNRAKVASKEVTTYQEQLAQAMVDFPGINPERLTHWAECEKQALQASGSIRKADKPQCWEEMYVQELQRFSITRAQMLSTGDTKLFEQHKRVADSLKQIEKKHGIENRWEETSPQFQSHKLTLEHRHKTRLLQQMRVHSRERSFLLSLQKKYPNGQAIFIRLSRQINIATRKIKKLARMYNGAAFGEGSLPPALTERDMLQPNALVYSLLEVVQTVPQPESNLPPDGVMQEVLDIYHRQKRAQEELKYIKTEICNVCLYLQEEQKLHITILQTTALTSGERALMIRKMMALEKCFLQIRTLFRDFQLPVVHLKYMVNTLEGYAEWEEESDVLLHASSDSSDSEDDIDADMDI